VHADASAYIALAYAMAHGRLAAWERPVPVGKDLTYYDFLSVTKEGFVPMSMQPASEA
jgi:hypothetical protein